MENYKILQKIGSGGQGSVYKVTNLHPIHNGTFMALKKVLRIYCPYVLQVQCTTLKELNFALSEAQCVVQLRSPHIVRCYEFFIDRASNPDTELVKNEDLNVLPSNELWNVCIAFEYCSKGTLKAVIDRQKQTTKRIITEDRVWKWIGQIVNAISHMHDKRLIHRDMKSENCFLAEDDEIRLGDMGLAKELIKDTASTVLGTSHFIAPELRTQEHSYTEKIDIWGIGCIAYELCTCRRSDFGYERAINAEKFFSHIDKKHYSKELVDFIKSCMETNPDLRPTAREIAKKYNDYFSIEIDTPITPFIRDEGSHFETTNSKSKPTFYTLNLDIYRIIFRFLDAQDLCKSSLVCHAWHHMINTEFKTYLWKHLYKWHWATPLDYNQEQRIFTHFDSVHDSFIYQAQLEQNWKTSKFRYAEYQVHSGDGINSIRVVSDDELDTEQCLKNIYSIKQQYGSQRKNAYHDLSFEANGNHAIAFTASDDGTVKIHDIYGLGTSSVMKQHVQTLGGMTGRTSSLDFKPRILDKVVIAGGYDKSILMWDFMTSFLVHRFVNAHDDHVLDVCLVDAISFASSSANDLKVFDTNSKQVIKEYKNGYEKIVTDKKELFSQIACGASTGGVHIYDIRSSSAQAMITLAPTTVTVHAGSPVSAMQWCGNQFFKCTKSGLLECFDIRRGKTPFMNDFSSNGDIRGLYANGAHTITACKSGAIVMSSATTGKFINKIYREGHRQNLQCMNVSAKVMVTGGLNGVMSVHDFTKVETVVAEPLSEDTLSSKRNITPKQSCRQQ